MDLKIDMRRVFFGSAHKIRADKRPSKKMQNFFQKLAYFSQHLNHCDRGSELCDFRESLTINSNNIGKYAQEVEFANGMLIIGKLVHGLPYFQKQNVIYCCYFGNDSKQYCCYFAAVPKGKKIKITFGRDMHQYYVNITCKEGWNKLDFASGTVYKCKMHKGVISHKASKQQLPEICFANTCQDEEQQALRSNESWEEAKGTFILRKGKLFLL